MKAKPSQFIDVPIEVIFDSTPALQKEPNCPNGFLWQGQKFHIVQLISSWCDFHRRGRMDRNMQPIHLARARNKGSWGVGRFHFCVKTEEGRFFELYYDRAPQHVADRKGHWVLLAELKDGNLK